MDYNELANLIFPDAKGIEYYEEKYPERNLEEGAMVTRFAPSPTGFVHIGGLFGAIIDRKLAEQSKGELNEIVGNIEKSFQIPTVNDKKTFFERFSYENFAKFFKLDIDKRQSINIGKVNKIVNKKTY